MARTSLVAAAAALLLAVPGLALAQATDPSEPAVEPAPESQPLPPELLEPAPERPRLPESVESAPEPPSGSVPWLAIPTEKEEAKEAEQPAPEPESLAPPAPSASPTPAAEQPALVIRTILGLVVLLALAYLGGHPRVRAWERKVGIAQVVTAGFPFIALGLIASAEGVGVLSPSVLATLSPLLRVGLGWIGFMIGFRFDARLLDTLPQGTAPVVGLSTGIPFAFVVAGASALLVLATGWDQVSLRDPIFLRDALVLGTAGAMTARSASRLLSGRSDSTTVEQIIRLEELAGIVGMAFIAAYFRPGGGAVTWQLPGTAWLFLTLGLGAAIGVVAYAILRRHATGAESLVLILGTISFASGAASVLRLSPIVVCFVAGVLLVNFPGSYKPRLAATLEVLERPIYLVFLVVVGAIWKIGDWRGWVLMVVFVATRLAGKWAGTALSAPYADPPLAANARMALVRAPMGQLSIAIVVSAQLLYPGGDIPFIVTAVIGGALITELLVQYLVRKTAGANAGGQP